MIRVLPFVFYKNFVGLTLWPFILIKDRQLRANKTLINHERIHLRQQAELLVIPFYFWYVIEWGIRVLVYRNAKKAYRNLSFEREAYAQESNSDYLQERPPYRFIKYL